MNSPPDSTWSDAQTVAGFSQSPPNPVLLKFVEEEQRRCRSLRIIDIGGGAGRNAIPIAQAGSIVVGTDLSWPMLLAAKSRARETGTRLHEVRAPMDALPARDRSFDLVVAHGIWNLARSGAEFRRAVSEAARVSRPGAGLFVFTFSRNTLPNDAPPIAGETFVFTQFSGRPQCFLTADELIGELALVGFRRDASAPLTEYNRPRPGELHQTRGPVIYEGIWRLSAG